MIERKMKWKCFAIAFLALVMLFPVAGQPSLEQPHNYYGEVMVDGEPAPDGLLVTAKINGQDVAATTTVEGKFGFDGSFYVSDTDGTNAGETVKFYVEGEDTGESVVYSIYPDNDPSADSWSAATELNLDISGVTITTLNSPAPLLGRGGSGGSGGSGGAAPALFKDDGAVVEDCDSDWTCSDWLPCISGRQKRVCVDANRCDNADPEESRECEVELTTEQVVANEPFNEDNIDLLDGQAKKGSPILGAVLGGGAGTWVAVMVFAVIIAGILMVYLYRKGKEPPESDSRSNELPEEFPR
ncbi:hypothetical protein ACFL1B_05150 [Nanoarchaeota archaeon]